MLLLSFNKAGLLTTLVLLLLGLSLCPACGRPSFQDADPVEDEANDEGEDLADDQDEDDTEEENDSKKFDGKECANLKDQAYFDCLRILIAEMKKAAAGGDAKAKEPSTSGSSY